MANPNSLILDRYQDIHNTDKTLFNQFITLYNNGDFDGAKAVLDEICLSCKGKTSNIFNQIINALNKMESLYTDNVQEYLANLLSSLEEIKYVGVYDSGAQYKTNNMVAYNDEMYLCLTNTTAGTLPTVEASWLYLGLKGDVGSGYIQGISYLGNWEAYGSSYVFNINNLVLEDGVIYYCILQNTNKRPSENPTYWTVFMYENRQEIEGIDKLPEIYGVKGVGFENSELERTHDSVGLTYEKFPNPDVVTEGVSNSMITPLENTVGGNYIQATNIIENGDFSNGSTRWSATGGNLSVLSNTLSVTGDGTEGVVYAFQATLTPFTAGKKIRLKYKARVDTDDCVRLEVYVRGSITGSMNKVKTVNNPDALIWQDIDFITTLPTGHTGNLLVYVNHVYNSSAIADTKVMEVQEFYGVDLTADFGAGREPDLTECERIFPVYFEGRQMFDLDKGGVFQSFVEKQYFANQLISNGNFASGTTGWSGNDATVSIVSGNLRGTSNGNSANPYLYSFTPIYTTSANDKIYIRLKVRVNNDKCQSMRLYIQECYNGIWIRNPFDVLIVNNPIQDQWYDIDNVYTLTSNIDFNQVRIRIAAFYPDLSTSNGKTHEIKGGTDGVLLVNLTDTFGSGFEPSLSECQSLFPTYFSGEKEIWYTNGGGFQDFQINGLTVTNLITNGNFADGTTGFTANKGSLSINIDGNLVFTADGTNLAPYVQKTMLPSTINNSNIFIKYRFRCKDNNVSKLICYINDLTNTISTINNPIKNQWYEVSVINTTLSFESALIRIIPIYTTLEEAYNSNIEIDYIMVINLTATFGAGLEPDLATCQTLFPSYFDGTISVDKGEVSVIGKNLFDKSMGISGMRLDLNGITSVQATTKISDYIPVITGFSYVRNCMYDTWQNRGVAYDINKAWLYDFSFVGATVVIPSGVAYIRTNLAIEDNDIFQLELGSTATTYAPYNVTRARYPKLQSVPAITDTYNVLSGLHTQNVQRYVLTADDILTLDIGFTNVDTVYIKKKTNYKYYGTIEGVYAMTCYPYSVKIIHSAGQDSLDNINSITNTLSDIVYVLFIAKGTYADLATAKTALAGTVIYYQLATPILTQYPAINIPLLEKSTIQYAPYIYDTGTYSTSFSITDTDYPISTLVEVTRNGVPIDISTCTIAGGGLSFTSTVLASGDEISVRYNHGLPTATPTTEYILNTPSLTTSRIYSDFDSHFPYNEITEVTDSAGNVFVRIPKFYTYRDANSIAISKYKISDLWELNPVFMFGGEERDYVYIGKYEASGSTSRIYSKPSQNVLVSITKTQGRTASLANGSTYFQSDIWVNQLLRDLFTVEFATTNSQSIMYGYAKDNTVAISTGNTNIVSTPTGSPTDNESGNYASKYRGVENVWGNVYKFIDGVTSYGNAIYVAYDPSLYIDGNNTNHNLVGYNTIPQMSVEKYADINGFDKYNPFAIMPISVGDDSQGGYSDQFYKQNNNTHYLIWREGGYWDSEYGAGIWLLRGSTITNDIYTGTRLCAYDIT